MHDDTRNKRWTHNYYYDKGEIVAPTTKVLYGELKTGGLSNQMVWQHTPAAQFELWVQLEVAETSSGELNDYSQMSTM